MRPALLIPLILVVLTVVVIALPLLLSQPEDVKSEAPPLGVVGLQYAFLDKEYPVVTRVIENSPAALAGIEKNDKLQFINGNNASMMGDYEIYKNLCGEPGSTLPITIETHGYADVMDKSVTRIRAGELPNRADARYLIEQAQMSKDDFLQRRDSLARPGDFSYTSLLMYHLHKGPVIVEFYDGDKGASASLARQVELHNKSAKNKGAHDKITLLSCASNAPKYYQLAKHFKVDATPVYIFIPGNRGIVLARNIFRSALSDEQLETEIKDLVYQAKQPIAEINTPVDVRGDEIETHNHSYKRVAPGTTVPGEEPGPNALPGTTSTPGEASLFK